MRSRNIGRKFTPKKLVLNEENENDIEATFLDLEIGIDNKQYVTKIFDK